jgi:hypothetical protein
VARPERGRRALLALAATIVLAGGLLLGRSWLAIQRDDDRAGADLRATQDEVDAVRAEHEAAVADVEALRVALEADLATLAARQAETATAQGNSDAAAATLTDLQGQLASSSAELAASSGRLGTLQRCLVGVAEGLNQVAVGDPRGLSETLRVIEGTCAAAGAQL